MKMKHRILSMLLALTLIIGILPTVVPSVVDAAVADAPAGVRNHLPSTATDIVYLSDMTWEYSNNNQGKEAIKNGAWSNGATIFLGATSAEGGGTSFEKGLGVMPLSNSSDHTVASQTIFDLADNNYAHNFFYSAAGITNGNGITKDPSGDDYKGVVFEVWGSYDKSVENYKDAEFQLIESSGTVTKGYVYQFHLDISGVRYLKLIVYTVGNLTSMNSAWGGTCLYNNAGYYPKSDLMGLNNGQDNSTWVPTGTDRFHTYNFNNLPDNVHFLSATEYKDASTNKGTSKVIEFKSASSHLGSGAYWLGGVADTLTCTNPNLKDGILLKNMNDKYLRFNCRTPANSNNQTDGWVIFDISDLNVNRFYAVIGSGNNTAKHTAYAPADGKYGGVTCEVLGAYEEGGEYTLLSASEPIMLSQTGEFNVDITGVKYLKLRIQAKDYRVITGLDTLFAWPAVYYEWDVSATGATTAVQGTEVNYSANIWHDFSTVTDYAAEKITWAVEGAQKEGTNIDASGKLTVDPYETATELKVTASITEGGQTITSRPVTVAVSASPVYTLEIKGPGEAGKNSEHDISAFVTKNGETVTYENIQWELSGNTDTATKLENGKLTIGNEPVGTTLTVKASYTEYGILHEDTLEITVIAYTIELNGHSEMLSGGKVDMSATILNEGQPVDGTVEWSIDGIGILAVNGNVATVRADNTVGRITVTAKWTSPAGTVVSQSQEIIVTAYTIDVSGAATAVTQGSEVTISAKVEKNGAPIDGNNISWKIVNMRNAGVTEQTGAELKLTVTEDVGTVFMITASIEIGGQIVSDSFTLTVSDYKIVIDPSSVEVPQGSSTELKATVSKGDTAVDNAVISWQVTNVDGSALNISGNALKLTADGKAGTVMTVVATAVIDNKTIVSAPVTVTVVAAPEYAVTITDSVTSIKQGESASFVASVTKDGEAVADAELIWIVSGKSAAATVIDSNGKLTVDKAELVDTKLTITASILVDGKLITSEAVTVNVTLAPQQDAYKTFSGEYFKLPAGAIYLADDGIVWIESSNYQDKAAIKNGAWSNGGEIWIGGESNADVKDGTKFTKGIGVQCKAPAADNDNGASWTTIDISALDCDTFYAAIGCTNASNQQNGHSSFIYQVYGATTVDGEYALLAESEPITKTTTGEFTVDITGVNYLKLVIKCADGSSHAYGNSVWANAAVYKAKEDAYVIDVDASADVITQGEELTFTASATKNGEAMTDAVFTWAVSGAAKEGTKIDATGKLVVDTAEAAGTKLSITASITVGDKTYTSAPVEITVKAAPQDADQKDAYTTSNGSYMALPNGVIYLSDIDWTESKNLGEIETIKNGTYSSGAAIWLGGESGGKVDDGTKFVKGLGVMPYNPTDGKNGAAHTIWDISTLNVNTFYGVVGITNGNGQNYGYGDPYGNGTFTGGGVIFEVYGDYEGNGEFKLLAESETITKTTTGEFKVDITGVKYLKLVVKCAMEGSGKHTSMNSAWGNACVYASTSTSTDSYTISASASATTVEQGKNTSFTSAVTKNGEALADASISWAVTGGSKSGTKIDANGKLTIDKKEPAGTKLSVTASITVDGTTYTSAAVEITVAEAPSNYYQKDAFKTATEFTKLNDNVIYLSDVAWIESVNLNGAQAIKNGAWSNGGAIWIGGESNDDVKDGTEFKKGIGVQCQAPNSENNNGASWTTIDVSKLGCDTFYAAVGLTNKANQENGHNSFIFQVYGATKADGDFILLAESGAISKTETGEFTVDISDMKVLKLVIKCTDGGSHAYGNSVWANACVYNKDGSAGNPDGGAEDKPVGEKPAQENAYTSFGGAYLTPSGTIIYLSDIDWKESNNLSNIETIRDGTYKNGDPIWLGGASGGKVTDGTKFKKGLGVMPFAPNDGKNGAADTIWDVSTLNVNTFYGVVGITNGNGQNYGFGDPYNDSTFAGGGVVFQVFGTYEDGGEFKLLAESEIITKTMTGEFKVDITGVKLLKLVVKCNLDTGSGHTSMNSAWGNACVFNSASGSLEEGSTTEPTTKPTEDNANKPTRPAAPTAPTTPGDADNADSGNGGIVIIIGVCVALLIAIAVAVALIVRKNKKR